MSTADREAADRVARQRWPGGIRCAHCESPRVAVRNRPERRWPQWRCRDCRREFTAVTGTTLHGTRRRPSDVAQMYAHREPAEHRHATETGAHRIRSGPLRDASRATAALVDALRHRPSGATLHKLAAMAGISARHARRCLEDLARRDIAESFRSVTADGHMTIPVSLWKLAYSDACFEALGHMPRMARASASIPSDSDAVPARFWNLFWSGTPGPELRIRDHGVHIGGTLIGGRHVGAECWALRHLPTKDLTTLRAMRGYDTGDTARVIDAETKRRSRAAA